MQTSPSKANVSFRREPRRKGGRRPWCGFVGVEGVVIAATASAAAGPAAALRFLNFATDLAEPAARVAAGTRLRWPLPHHKGHRSMDKRPYAPRAPRETRGALRSVWFSRPSFLGRCCCCRSRCCEIIRRASKTATRKGWRFFYVWDFCLSSRYEKNNPSPFSDQPCFIGFYQPGAKSANAIATYHVIRRHVSN